MVYLMERGLVLFVLTGVITNVGSGQTHYNFVNTPLNWTSAQRVCRDDFTDLATIESAADVDAVGNTASSDTGKAWIGLHDDLQNSWMWSLNDSSFYGEGEATYRNWNSGEPNNVDGREYCGVLWSLYNGKWADWYCSYKRRSVCFSGTWNGKATFVRTETLSTWTEAQRFCRENYVDLASIRNEAENEMVKRVAGDNSVWIGLYRRKVWSDGSDSLYGNWENNQPNTTGQTCVTTSLESGLWSDEGCSIQLPFVCYTATPAHVEDFRSTGQNQTSVTLQWNKVNNNISFILQFNGTETNIRAPDGDGPVTHTASSLSAATEYTFTVFSVFGSVRSGGVSINAVTEGPYYVYRFKVRYSSSGELSQDEKEALLDQLIEKYGLPPQSVRNKSIT